MFNWLEHSDISGIDVVLYNFVSITNELEAHSLREAQGLSRAVHQNCLYIALEGMGQTTELMYP